MTSSVPMGWEEMQQDDVRGVRLPVLEGIRVMVVDDDPDAREAISAVLEDCSAHVLSVGSATAALAVVRTFQPDVLVSDIAMPGVDGHRFIRRLRALDAACGGATPAAALTAYATPNDRMRALLAGYQVFLAKPFDPAELVSLVARLARRPPNA